MSKVHITNREHGDVPGSHWGPLVVQGLCRTGPAPHCIWHSGEITPFLTSSNIGRVGPEPWLDSSVELLLEVRVQVTLS